MRALDPGHEGLASDASLHFLVKESGQAHNAWKVATCVIAIERIGDRMLCWRERFKGHIRAGKISVPPPL